MSEEKKNAKTQRDTRGLTLEHRALLRLFIVSQQTGTSAAKVGDETSLSYLLGTPLVASAVQDLLVSATELAKKIGSTEEIAQYLNEYAREDNAFFAKCQDKHFATAEAAVKEQIEEAVNDALGVADESLCVECGEGICSDCQVCHNCTDDVDESSRVLN